MDFTRTLTGAAGTLKPGCSPKDSLYSPGLMSEIRITPSLSSSTYTPVSATSTANSCPKTASPLSSTIFTRISRSTELASTVRLRTGSPFSSTSSYVFWPAPSDVCVSKNALSFINADKSAPCTFPSASIICLDILSVLSVAALPVSFPIRRL